MTDDFVTRLRELAEFLMGNSAVASEVREAADEIERLRGQLENVQRDRMAQVEVERLRALITEWADAFDDLAPKAGRHTDAEFDAVDDRWERAEAALRKEAGR